MEASHNKLAGAQLALLDAIRSESQSGVRTFDPSSVMKKAMAAMGYGGPVPKDETLQKAILILFNDYLRSGLIGMGDPKSVGSISVGSWPTSFHLTPEGNELLEQASRDPINPAGYLANIEEDAALDATTKDYVEEALRTYRACCFKATAVMIGAAVENLILNLRDELVGRLKARGDTQTKKLAGHKVKEITEEIYSRILPDLRSEAKKHPNTVLSLKEDAESRLLPIAADFRRLRNEAGHPASLTPIRSTDVHANLLQFASVAKLLIRLKKWVCEFYITG